MDKRLSFSFLLAAVFSHGAHSETYVATGGFTGTVCRGFVIEYCSQHEIVAVAGEADKIHELKRVFDSVDEYKERGKRPSTCIIRTKHTGQWLVSFAINKLKQQTFFGRDEKGYLEELNVQQIAFDCKKNK